MKTDAEASSEAVSLAVHQPMQFERRVVGGDEKAPEPCDEYALLRAFMAANLPEGRVILPIVGNSGIGKSHVIRWLDAQIRRLPNPDRRVVIRIPKGTSLKGVLTILLDELRGEPYEKYRRELTRAQQELDPHEAAGLLCEMLAYTLEEMFADARTHLLADPADRSAQEREAFCRPEMLPALLRNQLLRDQHFVRSASGGDGVIKRLVEQLTEGRAAGAEDDRQHLFTPDDLILDDRFDRDALGRDEKRAIGQLEREGRRISATQILNAALDGAKQRLLRLDPTVSDLFDAVRKQLLADEKELVLLVEDFAVLSGLQKQLLQVIIKEAVRDGQQVLCTMRTALAYTKGYMDTATVLTRANFEYHIPDAPGSEDEILDRIRRLIGAYLNAARLGQSRLEQEYQRGLSGPAPSREWVPSFVANVEPDARATLEAFGSTSDSYELFPLNVHAIDALAHEGCALQTGQLIYNPRFVIQNILNKVLVNREFFEQNAFPPATFGSSGRRLPAAVTEEVKRRVPPRDLDRYLRFLAYWGGCPEVPGALAEVERRFFLAFGLDSSVFGDGAGTSPVPRPNPADSPPPPKERPRNDRPGRIGDPRSPDETAWERVLENWRSGTQMPQAEANQLRKWVTDALKDVITFDWDLFRPLTRDTLTWNRWFSEWVYIPNAAGHGGRTADKALVVLCSEDDLADEAISARVHANVMSLVRFHGIRGGTWDYEGAEEDLPRYAALVEDLASRARGGIRERYFKAEWDPIPALVQGLLIGARALGVEGALRDDLAGLTASLFAPSAALSRAPTGAAPANEAESADWLTFTNGLRACRRMADRESRDHVSWASHLLNLVGARQGQADNVYAIDLFRLLPAIRTVATTWEFTEALPNPAGVAEFVPVRAAYLELKKQSGAISKTQRRLHEWRTQALNWLGDDFDTDALVRELCDTVETARAAGLTRNIDTTRLLQLVEEFRTADVKAAVVDVVHLVNDAPRGTVLAILGRGHWPILRLCSDMRRQCDEFVSAVNTELAREEMTLGADPVGEAKAALLLVISSLTTALKELQEHAARNSQVPARANRQT